MDLLFKEIGVRFQFIQKMVPMPCGFEVFSMATSRTMVGNLSVNELESDPY